MLARGGNAVDAALATAITLTVVEPCSNGLGSDLFAILWDGTCARRTERVGPRARGVVAGALPRTHAMPERGWDTVTIPGCVSGWRALSRPLRQAAVRRPVRARDPPRARRLSRVAGRSRRSGATPCR